MWPDLSSGSLLTHPLLGSQGVLTGGDHGKRQHWTSKGGPMWESTTKGLRRTLKVTTGHLSCQHWPGSGQRLLAYLSSANQTVLPGNYVHLSQLGVPQLKSLRKVCLWLLLCLLRRRVNTHGVKKGGMPLRLPTVTIIALLLVYELSIWGSRSEEITLPT